MQITIDTKVDSPDDIRKIMQILGHFAGKDQNQRAYTNYNSNSYSEPSTGSYGTPSTAQPAPQPDRSPDFSSFMGLMDQASANASTEKKVEEKKEIPRIMTF